MSKIIQLTILLMASRAFGATELALNWKPEPQFGGFYQAEIDGAYKKNGLDVKILEGGSGTPTVQMLANGKVDFAIVSAEEILINNDHNPDHRVVGIFAVFQKNPQMIMCHSEAGLNSIKDVLQSNFTLAWQSGLTYVQFLKKKYQPIQAHTVPYPGGIATYLNDKKYCQQGFATSEPIAAELAGQTARVFLASDEGFNPYTTVVAVRAETLEKSPALVKSMLAAVLEGWSHYLRDPVAANSKMHDLNKAMDVKTFAKSSELQRPLINSVRLGAMTAERWDTLALQLRDLGIIKNQLKAAEQFKNL